MRLLADGTGAAPPAACAGTRRQSCSSTLPSRWTEAVQGCTATGHLPDPELAERRSSLGALRLAPPPALAGRTPARRNIKLQVFSACAGAPLRCGRAVQRQGAAAFAAGVVACSDAIRSRTSRSSRKGVPALFAGSTRGGSRRTGRESMSCSRCRSTVPSMRVRGDAR
jgi:hypothetical protein